jgi:hypothetical protein
MILKTTQDSGVNVWSFGFTLEDVEDLQDDKTVFSMMDRLGEHNLFTFTITENPEVVIQALTRGVEELRARMG